MLTPNRYFNRYHVAVLRSLSRFRYLPVGYNNRKATVTRNTALLERNVGDPLFYLGPTRVGAALQIYKMSYKVERLFDELDVPFLIFHGDADRICDVKGSRNMFARAPVQDKTLRVFAGALHALLIEVDPVPAEVISETKAWLTRQLDKFYAVA